MKKNQKKVTEWKIPLYKIYTDEEDIKSISKVIKRGMEWTIGPEVEEFERLLANYLGIDYCLVFNSGTSAGHAALLSLKLEARHEVIIPSFTFIATANWVQMINAVPKFVDIEDKTLGLDPIELKKSITKNTKVVIPVHFAGLPCKIKEISEILKRKKLSLIEDASESLGATINKKKVGTFGDLSIFSFAPNKLITTGEGGAVVTNSKKLFEKLKLLRSHGRDEKISYFSSISKPSYITMGYNWRMSSITAALGISQLSKLEKIISLRRKNAKFLSSHLSKIKQVTIPNEIGSTRHVYQLYSILLPNCRIRNQLMNFLASKSIMSKVFFSPIHLTNFYKKLGFSRNKNLKLTESISNKILTLPMYPGLKKQEMLYMIESINEFFERS